MPNVKEHEMVFLIKTNKLLQKDDASVKISEVIQDKIAVKNVLTFYNLSKLYNIAFISESSLLYIERCFPMVCETQNFLHLEFSIVAKILSSSELNIHSEVEIFLALTKWLKHNSEERSKYAEQFLIKVRFSLLSEQALKYISNCDLIFSKKEDYVRLIKTVSANK